MDIEPRSTTATCKYCGTTASVQEKTLLGNSPQPGPPGGDFSAFGGGRPNPYMGGPPPPMGYPAPGMAHPPPTVYVQHHNRNSWVAGCVVVGLVLVASTFGMCVMLVGAGSRSSTSSSYTPPPAVAIPAKPVIATTPDGQRRECEAGSAVNCFELGLRYEKGRGVQKDDRMAITYYEKACEGDDAGGCANLGLAYSRGTGVAKNGKKYFSLSKKGCKLGSAVACNNVGWAYQSGEGTKKDIKKAIKQYDKACEKKSHFGCYNLAKTAKDNPKLKKDPQAVADLYEVACKENHGTACELLAKLYEGGPIFIGGPRIKPPDPAKAKLYFGKACSAGVSKACGK